MWLYDIRYCSDKESLMKKYTWYNHFDSVICWLKKLLCGFKQGYNTWRSHNIYVASTFTNPRFHFIAFISDSFFVSNIANVLFSLHVQVFWVWNALYNKRLLFQTLNLHSLWILDLLNRHFPFITSIYFILYLNHHMLRQIMQAFYDGHLDRLKRWMSYIMSGTMDHGIFYKERGLVWLKGYKNAS